MEQQKVFWLVILIIAFVLLFEFTFFGWCTNGYCFTFKYGPLPLFLLLLFIAKGVWDMVHVKNKGEYVDKTNNPPSIQEKYRKEYVGKTV
jgi:hypothetical protein